MLKTGAMNGFRNKENTCEWYTIRSLRIFFSETVLDLVNISLVANDEFLP